VNGIDDNICPRCDKEIEDWDHVWVCECNEFTIREIIEQSIVDFEEKLQEVEDVDGIEILRDCNIPFIQCLYEKSQVLLGCTREWEMLKGIYNNAFNEISNSKEMKKIVFDL